MTLREFRNDVVELLDDEWRSVTYFRYELGLGAGIDHYKLALVLERLAADGHAELKAKPGSSGRKFRRSERHLEVWER